MPRFGSRNSRPARPRRTRVIRRRISSCAMTRLSKESDPCFDPKANGIRHELVARVRQEILAGTYDTPAKLELALERLFEQSFLD